MNQPKILPPMMITGVISAGTAITSAVNTSFMFERGYFG